MTYKTVLALFNDRKTAEGVLQAAIALARQGDAHLVGLYVIPSVQYFYASAEVQIATEIFEAQESHFRELATQLKALFEREVPNDMPHEWREPQSAGPVTTSLAIRHAVCADVIVTGQVDPDRALEADQAAAERLVMESGRPVLVVPYAGKAVLPPTTVMACWNGSRESARSIFDALPLLQAAQAVKLLWVNPPEDEATTRAMAGAEMAAVLSRHGVKVETARSVGSDLSVGDELLSRAADFGADMIVMGAYGHSRLREYVLGGATLHLLRHMTVPVLMAH